MIIYEKKYTGLALKVGCMYLCYGSGYSFGSMVEKYYFGCLTEDIIIKSMGQNSDEIIGFIDFADKLTDEKIIDQCTGGEIVKVEYSAQIIVK